MAHLGAVNKDPLALPKVVVERRLQRSGTEAMFQLPVACLAPLRWNFQASVSFRSTQSDPFGGVPVSSPLSALDALHAETDCVVIHACGCVCVCFCVCVCVCVCMTGQGRVVTGPARTDALRSACQELQNCKRKGVRTRVCMCVYVRDVSAHQE